MNLFQADCATAAFERACLVGFFVITRQIGVSIFYLYEAWCREQGRPLVWIQMRNQKADVVLRMDTCGWHLDRDVLDELDCRIALIAPHGTVMMSATRCTISDVPAAQSEEVAFRLFEGAMDSRPTEVSIGGNNE